MALEHRRKAIEAQVEALRAQFKSEEEEFERAALSAKLHSDLLAVERAAMAKSRRSTKSNGKKA
nr:hypothetical protein [Chthoniobacter flavus]